MTAVLAALLGAVWFLVRAVLILLGVVVLVALLALVCPLLRRPGLGGRPRGRHRRHPENPGRGIGPHLPGVAVPGPAPARRRRRRAGQTPAPSSACLQS